MRIWVGVGLAILVGVGVGLATAWAKISSYPWTRNVGGEAAPVRIHAPPATTDAQAAPKVLVEKDTYDFGSMDANAADQHEFLFKNVGTGPLKLTKGDTTCKCTVAKLDEGEIPPGGTAKVVIGWTAKSLTGDFRHSATIQTNDPTRPRVTLTITGRITAVVKAIPPSLVFSRLAAGDEATASMRLYAYGADKKLEVKSCRFDENKNAKYFSVVVKPLTADQLKDELDAKSGIEARITLKPGLPVGPFRQRISISTNLEKAATLEIPIEGDIVSEISVTGREFDPETGVLMLGTIPSNQGAEGTVRIFVRGPYCRDVKFEPGEVVPSLLHVKIGKTTEMSNGAVTLTPVIIEVPKGSPPANHLGSEQGKLGRITLKTHHPQSPELRIYVRFAVEG